MARVRSTGSVTRRPDTTCIKKERFYCIYGRPRLAPVILIGLTQLVTDPLCRCPESDVQSVATECCARELANGPSMAHVYGIQTAQRQKKQLSQRHCRLNIRLLLYPSRISNVKKHSNDSICPYHLSPSQFTSPVVVLFVRHCKTCF